MVTKYQSEVDERAVCPSHNQDVLALGKGEQRERASILDISHNVTRSVEWSVPNGMIIFPFKADQMNSLYPFGG